MNKSGQEAARGQAVVSITKDSIVLCVLSGYIDEATVRKSLDETKHYLQLVKAQGRPTYLLIDATKVTGQTTGARTQAKMLGDMGIDKLAICNRNAALGLVIRYLIKASGMSKQSRVLRNQQQALNWLLQKRDSASTSDIRLRGWVALIIAVIAGLALFGWILDVGILKAWVPGLRDMNPVVAILLILQAAVLALAGRIPQSIYKKAALAISGVTFLFGLGVVIRAALDIQLHLDDWLFTTQLGGGLFTGITSPGSGLLLTLLAVMEFAVLTGQRERWQQYAFHVASICVVVVALLSIIGYGFGTARLYEITGLLPIPMNTAVCVLLLNYALQTLARPLPFFARGRDVFSRYSNTIIICLIIVFLTGIVWGQSINDQNKTTKQVAKEQVSKMQTTINNRLNGYIDSLRGYRSLFQSSDFVSAKEFHSFFTSSELKERHPGFTAITFVRAVPADQRAAFEASVRQQADAGFSKYREFAIFPNSSQSTLYPTLYVEPTTPTTRYGFDLSTNDSRRRALEKARDSGTVATTETIDLNASRADSSLPKRPGFYITIPVYKTGLASTPRTMAERRANLYGFTSAVFENKILFADLFKNVDQKDIKFVISRAGTGETLYTYNPHAKVEKDPIYTGSVKLADQTWNIALYAPKHFGVAGISRNIPGFILMGGILVIALAGALTIMQTRRKDQAVALAGDMTEDLNNERDAAVILKQKDEAILSSIGDGVFAIDPERRIILFNRAAAKITGKSEQAVLGTPYEQIMQFKNEKDRMLINQFIQAAFSGKRSIGGHESLLEREDGTLVPVSHSAAPIVNPNGQVEGVVVAFRDITRERELDRLKDEFVSMASHELRTPMGAIRALSSMILAGDYGHVSKNLKEPLEDIHSATLRLVNLVNDLLSVARIEAGRMKFNLGDVDCTEIVRQTATNLAPLGKEKGVDVSFTPAKKLPQVQIDSDKVTQVLTNLIGNSLKFTDRGAITVVATPQKDTVEITVSDTGAGISSQDQAKLFGKFQQISSAQEGRPQGTGLGLFISREIIRKMGGELWIKSSTVGKGTTFAFTLVKSHSAKAERIKQQLQAEEKQHPDAVS